MRKAIAASAIGLSMIAALPASADGSTVTHVYQGKDHGWATWHDVGVQDHECDGHLVRTQFYTLDSSGRLGGPYRVRDKDGCGGSAWHTSLAAGYSVAKIRVQERTPKGWASSRWKLVTASV